MAVRPLGIHIDQPHLHGRERVLQIAVTGVALIAEPGTFRAPIHILLGLPYVGPTAAEAKRFEAHRLERAIAGEHEQIGPGDFLAVFLFDRPKQPAGLVEIGVVGPTVERRKTQLTRSRPTAAVTGAIGARTVPRHTDEERPVMPEIRRPPLLRIRHQRIEVLLDRLEIERFELRRIIEVRAHRIGQLGVLVQHLQIELIRPPVAVRPAPGNRGRGF